MGGRGERRKEKEGEKEKGERRKEKGECFFHLLVIILCCENNNLICLFLILYFFVFIFVKNPKCQEISVVKVDDQLILSVGGEGGEEEDRKNARA